MFEREILTMKPLSATVGVSAFAVFALTLAGCTTAGGPASSKQTTEQKYQDSRQLSNLQTLDVESADVLTACNSVAQKIIANPLLANADRPPHFLIEPEAFENKSSNDLSTSVLVDLLRYKLLNAAKGRLVLVGREYADLVVRERRLRASAMGGKSQPDVKETATRGRGSAASGRVVKADDDTESTDADLGPVGPGTTPVADAILGIDYIIGGRISDVTESDLTRTERYTQITFDVVDAKTAEVVFCDLYYFKKVGESAHSWY